MTSESSGPTIDIELTDAGLFGNDAAEDEREDIFNSYALERPELSSFVDYQRALCIARAYKGEGKSALLRLARRKISQSKQDTIVVAKTSSELAPEVVRDDYATWTKAWKAAILDIFAREIGARINVAWTDDAMSLVEEAEKSGFRSRSVVSAILDRLKLPAVDVGGALVGIPERKTLGAANVEKTVQRWVEDKVGLWLFVDDVDKNFQNVDANRVRVASFFDACRELVKAIPELRIRTAIRPNVWTILRMEFESLSHVEQYTVDLQWSETDVRSLLFRRVQGYLRRRGLWTRVERSLDKLDEKGEKRVIALVFESPMKWGRGFRPPHVLLYTLAKHRPRWMIELSKSAAAVASRRHHRLITHDDLINELETFGHRRVQDTVAEFRAQCPQLEELITAFNRAPEQLATDELVKLIKNKILTHLTPKISGVTGNPTPLQVAALLFEVGLIYGRRDLEDGTYQHIGFAERPNLLKSRANVDDGLTWEIHPVYRQVLDMRTTEGFERQPTRRGRE